MTSEMSNIHFSSLFQPSEVICQTEESSRDKVLMSLLRLLSRRQGVGDVDEALRAVLERENELPTVVAPGMAMPHARLGDLQEVVVAVATSRQGIVYDPQRPDNRIKLIVLTLAPKAAPGAYLQAISGLATICRDPSTAEIVASLPTPEQVWSFFDKGGMVLPAHLKACDVMDAVQAQLQEHDTLQRAIDLFARHRLNEVPVVDQAGDLIGVVTAYELLRACLPDYVLMMDDLTPIMNFEPFAEVLRTESRTWLTQILTRECTTVQADAPAIEVAQEITRRRAARAYIVQGKKLLGVASIETFLSKILRE